MCKNIMTTISLTTNLIPQVIGVIDVTRSKEKGYQTLVKDGFCAEVITEVHFVEVVLPLILSFLQLTHFFFYQLDELRQIYEELPEFLQEVFSYVIVVLTDN